MGPDAAEAARRLCRAVDTDDLETRAAGLERIEDVLADRAADAGDCCRRHSL